MWEFLDGKEVTLHGIHGILKYEQHAAIYPRVEMHYQLVHHPSDIGKRSQAYQEKKRRMGDDWVTDLTNAPEEYVEIAISFGFTPPPVDPATCSHSNIGWDDMTDMYVCQDCGEFEPAGRNVPQGPLTEEQQEEIDR